MLLTADFDGVRVGERACRVLAGWRKAWTVHGRYLHAH
jgi:hypothetical protein